MTIARDYQAYLSTLNSKKFTRLYPSQAEVLAKYSASYAAKQDIAVELPTGAGKTPIALLIAGAWRDQGKRVAVLSANKTLARQMAREATELGLPFAYMEGRAEDIPSSEVRAYNRCQSIGIMNYWVYFNQNPIIDPADLLVMDDAHLAEHCLHSLYSIEIGKFRHGPLFVTLLTELQARFPDYGIVADALCDTAPPTSTAELLSFVDQDAVADRIREIIDAHVAASGVDPDLKFRWLRVRSKLRDLNIYVSQNSLWLRPYVYPLTANPHYANVKQSLYMSATVGDPGDLARRLGTRPIDRIAIDPQHIETTSGRRLVVMNRTNEDTGISAKMSAALLAALRRHPKSLWLCNSESDATKWREVVSQWLAANNVSGHPMWTLTSMGDEVDQFRRAHSGHLFVAGRFDGMDFKDDECRIVVITTLPRAINLQEEFITSYLRDAGFMRRRLNQRIVQALGRCNRAPSDYAVYFMADQRFATHFSREVNREGLSRNVQTEIDLAQDIAEMSEGDVVERVERFLQRDFSRFDPDIKARAAYVPSTTVVSPLNDTSPHEVVAWAALDSQNYPVAADRFGACWDLAKKDNVIELGALHGYHRAKALYLQGRRGDTNASHRALQALDDAIARGGRSAWFNRMHGSLLRARADTASAAVFTEMEYAEAVLRTFDDLLDRVGTTGGKFQSYLDKITTKLSSSKHPEYQDGLDDLGRILAYAPLRPKYGAATDCRWRGSFGHAREVFTFEVKIEHQPSGKIAATDLGQAHNQLQRALLEFSRAGFAVHGTIVTHMTELEPNAVSSVGPIAILGKNSVLALWQTISVLLSTYRSMWSLDDVKVRAQAAEAVRPRMPKTGWLQRAISAKAPYVSESVLVAEWKGVA